MHLVTTAHLNTVVYTIAVQNVSDQAVPANIVRFGLETAYVFNDCTDDFDPTQEFTVPADGSTVYSSPLQVGVSHIITVRGTYQYWHPSHPEAKADAEWANAQIGLGFSWVNLSDSSLELLVDEQDLDWGPYSIEHTYTKEILGTGNPLGFRIEDSNYWDNIGGLNVSIMPADLSSRNE